MVGLKKKTKYFYSEDIRPIFRQKPVIRGLIRKISTAVNNPG
jgi:hypothetical protein